ncbi:MAG: tetratricopeptide repeat protein [Bacteroidales bacterium]
MNVKLPIFLLVLVFPITTYSQKKPEPEFLKYLSDKEFYEEVLFIIENSSMQIENQGLQDSLNYLRGWSYYALKQLNNSTKYLKKVSPESPFYPKSEFFASYNQMHLGNYQRSKEILETIETKRNNQNALINFELAGNALLRREYNEFNQHIKQTNKDYYAIAKEVKKLEEFASTLENHRSKSPVLATFMSGIIPGSGKIYAGKTGEGISSLITAGGMGFVTWENYRKAGPTHIKTLFFGAVFAVFYIGNIYGTYFTVKLAENEFQNEYDNKILFNLHIPLRSVFN